MRAWFENVPRRERGVHAASPAIGSAARGGVNAAFWVFSKHPLSFRRKLTGLSCAAAFVLFLGAESARACTACYGQSDSLLAQGMNWGILALLVVVLTVLTGIVAFFVHVAKRTANANACPTSPPASATTPEI